MRILLLTLVCWTGIPLLASAQIRVTDINSLQLANANAQPGDEIVLDKNGNWKNVNIQFTAKGTAERPITYRGETDFPTKITGKSRIQIGGQHIVIKHLQFEAGYAGKHPVVQFKTDDGQLANHCQLTHVTINSFNNPTRKQENYWIALYGRNNRIDHCQFENKLNFGVLLAVILDTEASRENYHRIDSNYFGKRKPLGGNSGEIIRVGVSEHCTFNSHTRIESNFFDACDGEAEIISIKSGGNWIRQNLFRNCQGSVVLRHGDGNTVEGNIFLGQDGFGTGGVRVINKNQWVINNVFYQCRGVGFRAPLVVMNGVPNSPANRYVAAQQSLIGWNTFIDCSPISLCDGADAERSEAPSDIRFMRNLFIQTKNRNDSLARIEDQINGFYFADNRISPIIPHRFQGGFEPIQITLQEFDELILPTNQATVPTKETIPDTMLQAAQTRVHFNQWAQVGASLERLQEKDWVDQIRKSTHGLWGFAKRKTKKTIVCSTATQIEQVLQNETTHWLTIQLSAPKYIFEKPLNIDQHVTFTTDQKSIQWETTHQLPHLFYLRPGGSLDLIKLPIQLKGINVVSALIRADTTGASERVNLHIDQCRFRFLYAPLYQAAKHGFADSLVIRRSTFKQGAGTLLALDVETDKKGWYPVESILFEENTVERWTGSLLRIQRLGNDESTLGPQLAFSGNRIRRTIPQNKKPLLDLNGVQFSNIHHNYFKHAHKHAVLIQYTDQTRAYHQANNNRFSQAGKQAYIKL